MCDAERCLQAVEAYRQAQKLEPDDQQLQQASHRAQIAAAKMASERKHTFTSRPAGAHSSAPAAKKPKTSGAARGQAGLSFADDEEQDS